jgi:hypothetical protein
MVDNESKRNSIKNTLLIKIVELSKAKEHGFFISQQPISWHMIMNDEILLDLLSF